jgi:hypothetical protein
MRWWRKVRRANISQELRDTLERYGPELLIQWIAGGVNYDVITQNHNEILSWLTERRDIAERHDQRVETLEWAILIFVGIEVLHDLPSMIQWLLSVVY